MVKVTTIHTQMQQAVNVRYAPLILTIGGTMLKRVPLVQMDNSHGKRGPQVVIIVGPVSN